MKNKKHTDDYNFSKETSRKLPCTFESQCINLTKYDDTEPYQVYTCKLREDDGTCSHFHGRG